MNAEQNALVLCDILQHELELPDGRTVIYNQNFKAPNDTGIYVVVGLQSVKVIASNSRTNPDTGQNVQSVVTATNYWIDFTSQGTEAMERQTEVVAAVSSVYSEQRQEENYIQISRTSQILDLSFIEGPSALYRYRFNVIVKSVETITKDVETFDKFTAPEEVAI